MSEETKVCTECHIEKSVDQFYKIPYSGNPERYCKVCKCEMQKRYKPKPKTESGNKNEQYVIATLRSHGIYAVTGKASEFNRVDVVAWGCVRIEVKSSSVNETGYYHYGFTPRQREHGIQGDLVCISTQGDYPLAIFPAYHPLFYTPSGTLKQAFAWEPRMRKTKSKMGTVVLSGALMREYTERWDLIEAVRQQRIQEMIGTGNINIKRVEVRSPQMKMLLD